MKKILIIGQAPPAQSQAVPYDSTLLYDILSWVGITIDQAQMLFDFDALSDVFPGFDDKGGHKKPSKDDMDRHYAATLEKKIVDADKIILLGMEAKKLFPQIGTHGIYADNGHHGKKSLLFLPHPSKRNYSLIMNRKSLFTVLLKDFLK